MNPDQKYIDFEKEKIPRWDGHAVEIWGLPSAGELRILHPLPSWILSATNQRMWWYEPGTGWVHNDVRKLERRRMINSGWVLLDRGGDVEAEMREVKNENSLTSQEFILMLVQVNEELSHPNRTITSMYQIGPSHLEKAIEAMGGLFPVAENLVVKAWLDGRTALDSPALRKLHYQMDAHRYEGGFDIRLVKAKRK